MPQQDPCQDYVDAVKAAKDSYRQAQSDLSYAMAEFDWAMENYRAAQEAAQEAKAKYDEALKTVEGFEEEARDRKVEKNVERHRLDSIVSNLIEAESALCDCRKGNR